MTLDAVDDFYSRALAAGGHGVSGPPDSHPSSDPAYYSAYVLDPDGNGVEAVLLVEETGKRLVGRSGTLKTSLIGVMKLGVLKARAPVSAGTGQPATSRNRVRQLFSTVRTGIRSATSSERLVAVPSLTL